MEPLKSQNLLSPVKTNQLTNFSKKPEQLSNLTPDEKEIIEVKYKSLPFGKMTDQQLFENGYALILKIHVITGWIIPAKEFMDILRDQFTKKLKESYKTVNADEVEYAFRNNAVKDWGKAMNLNLIDEVMAPYLHDRRELSRLEEEAKKPKQIEFKGDEITDEELVNITLESYKVVKKHELIPVSVYDYLFNQNEIVLTIPEKKAIYAKVQALINQNLAYDDSYAQTYENINDKEAFIKNECKKFSVARYFDSLIEKGC